MAFAAPSADTADDDLFVPDVEVVGHVEMGDFASRQACHGSAFFAEQVRMSSGTALAGFVMRTEPPYAVEALHLVDEHGLGQHGKYSIERHAVKPAVCQFLQQFEVRERSISS